MMDKDIIGKNFYIIDLKFFKRLNNEQKLINKSENHQLKKTTIVEDTKLFI